MYKLIYIYKIVNFFLSFDYCSNVCLKQLLCGFCGDIEIKVLQI